MNNKQLTICITTFNRQHELLATLKSLEVQGLYNRYCIIISDNCSDYDIEKRIKQTLSKEFIDIITIYKRRVNVGGSINIAEAFLLPKTEWMWLLSDDDFTLPTSIQTILKDINETNACWIKYSINNMQPFEDKECDNLVDVIKYSQLNGQSFGRTIFIGNNVYNLNKLKKYLPDIPVNAKSRMPHLFAPFAAISFEKQSMIYKSAALTQYNSGHASYDLSYVYFYVGNLLYTGIFKDKKEIKSFKNIKFFSPRSFISCLALVEDENLRWEYFKKVFVSHYKLFSIKGLTAISYYMILKFLGPQRWNVLKEKRLRRILRESK